MMTPLILGVTAAAVVGVTSRLSAWVGAVFPAYSAPIFLLAVTCIAMLTQRFLLDRRAGPRAYDGLADLFVHVHSIGTPDSPLRWCLRGINSLLFAFFGGFVGMEGAATEFSHAAAMRMRGRPSNRFEQRRRTDASCSLAAGISAAFGAPFTAIVMPIELGMGGPALPSIISALSAYVGVRLLADRFLPGGFFNLGGLLDTFQLSYREWLAVAAIALFAGAAGALLIRLIRYIGDSLRDLFQTQAWMRTLTAGVLLFFLAMIYKAGHAPPPAVLEQALWARIPRAELALLFGTQALGLAFLLSGFGTVGLFWPLFTLGSVFGLGIDHLVLQGVPGITVAAGLAGGAAFWGAILGTPLAAGLLAFELTHSVQALVIGLVAAYAARGVVQFLRTSPLVERDLEARGIELIDGRSAAILQAIPVRDAMLTDHETVHENEPIYDLYGRLLKARHPFLPVVNGNGVYRGLLTIDMVQEAWQSHEAAAEEIKGLPRSALGKLVEAKDLLYRSGFKAPTVKVNDRLAVTAGLFDATPCIPVLSDDGKVAGLLFVFNVRLAYDREVARRSLIFESREVT